MSQVHTLEDYIGMLSTSPPLMDCFTHSEDSQQVPITESDWLDVEESCDRAIIPSSALIGGAYSFHVNVARSVSRSHIYARDERLLFINKRVPFVAEFSFETPPPQDSVISAMVLCADPGDVGKYGAVKRCKKHILEDGALQFLQTSNVSAMYGCHSAHQVTNVPLSAMPVRDGVHTCLYECSCYNTCFFGRGNTKSTLIVAFSLTNNAKVIGRDVITLRCCSGPIRDARKRENAAEVAGCQAKRLQQSDDSGCSDSSDSSRCGDVHIHSSSKHVCSSTSNSKRVRSSSSNSKHVCSSSSNSKRVCSSSSNSKRVRSSSSRTGVHNSSHDSSSDSKCSSSGGSNSGTCLRAGRVHPAYNFIGNDEPDADGYYTFKWKLKDPFIYNMLKIMKYSNS